jgi:hypothetical protein
VQGKKGQQTAVLYPFPPAYHWFRTLKFGKLRKNMYFLVDGVMRAVISHICCHLTHSALGVKSFSRKAWGKLLDGVGRDMMEHYSEEKARAVEGESVNFQGWFAQMAYNPEHHFTGDNAVERLEARILVCLRLAFEVDLRLLDHLVHLRDRHDAGTDIEADIALSKESHRRVYAVMGHVDVLNTDQWRWALVSSDSEERLAPTMALYEIVRWWQQRLGLAQRLPLWPSSLTVAEWQQLKRNGGGLDGDTRARLNHMRAQFYRLEETLALGYEQVGLFVLKRLPTPPLCLGDLEARPLGDRFRRPPRTPLTYPPVISPAATQALAQSRPSRPTFSRPHDKRGTDGASMQKPPNFTAHPRAQAQGSTRPGLGNSRDVARHHEAIAPAPTPGGLTPAWTEDDVPSDLSGCWDAGLASPKAGSLERVDGSSLEVSNRELPVPSTRPSMSIDDTVAAERAHDTEMQRHIEQEGALMHGDSSARRAPDLVPGNVITSPVSDVLAVGRTVASLSKGDSGVSLWTLASVTRQLAHDRRVASCVAQLLDADFASVTKSNPTNCNRRTLGTFFERLLTCDVQSRGGYS